MGKENLVVKNISNLAKNAIVVDSHIKGPKQLRGVDCKPKGADCKDDSECCSDSDLAWGECYFSKAYLIYRCL